MIKRNYLILILVGSLITLILVFLLISTNTKKGTEEEFQDDIILRPLRYLEKGNGIVTNIWVDRESLDILREHNIKYLFVDMGDTGQDGRIKTTEEETRRFLDLIGEYETENSYDFIILPYSEINTYNYNIVSESFRKNFIDDYKNLVLLGFDGVYIDIEPVRKGQEESYLDLLKTLNTEIPENKIIGVYSGAVSFSIFHTNEWEWTLDFYDEISENVDLIFVPGYDLGLDNKEDYQEFIKKQIEELSSRYFNSNLMLGVPAHKQEPETIENALDAYESAEDSGNYFIGIGLFAEWTLEDEEWKIFEEYV